MKKRELLKHVSDYEIFTYYLGKNFTIGEMMSSPFPNRRDDNPSFNIFKHYGGELMFKDFAYELGDCIKFVSLMYNIRIVDAIDKIAKDFKINDNRKPYIPIIKEKIKTKISIITQPFTIPEIIYWYSYGINSETLNKFKIKSVKEFKINNSKKFLSRNLCFVYYFKNGVKIYKPLDNDGYKWITNCNGGFQGWEQLPIAGSNLIITKSLKDIAVLYDHKIPAIAPHGENMKISKNIIDSLKQRFGNIFILYDCDKAGYIASETLVKNYNLKRFFVNSNYCIYKNKHNEIKDISDYRKSNGKEKTEKLIRKHLSI